MQTGHSAIIRADMSPFSGSGGVRRRVLGMQSTRGAATDTCVFHKAGLDRDKEAYLSPRRRTKRAQNVKFSLAVVCKISCCASFDSR